MTEIRTGDVEPTWRALVDDWYQRGWIDDTAAQPLLTEFRRIAGEARRLALAEVEELLREAVETIHQTGSIRDHSDPNDKTGWNVHGVETCEDPLCRDILAAIEEARKP